MPAATTVIILGPYRSGTSLTACVLHELGVTFGPRQGMVPADQRNPSGYFERDDINAANTALIESAGGTLGEPGAPETIAANGNLNTLASLDLRWLHDSALTGIKDHDCASHSTRGSKRSGCNRSSAASSESRATSTESCRAQRIIRMSPPTATEIPTNYAP
jgi:hypothetical protein